MYLLLPLVSAVVYVIGALLLKRASDLGADIWRTTRIINYTSALVAAPLWMLGGTIPASALWWQPPVVTGDVRDLGNTYQADLVVLRPGAPSQHLDAQFRVEAGKITSINLTPFSR